MKRALTVLLFLVLAAGFLFFDPFRWLHSTPLEKGTSGPPASTPLTGITNSGLPTALLPGSSSALADRKDATSNSATSTGGGSYQFRGPSGPPHIKGPNGPPPNY